ncbi:hypothetical protein SELMODRAFT_414674 [Selaginella moellendorffii]|uniref:Neprosin PEP catalytic domain-containing protein n=1 Tax=Selaginella moellendorffii TaxID=88036 RepID=D8RTJ6_SELML|nr:hypothetical protein SELMODRAFT_414674 [Selaginella moellendorffii]
MLLLMLLMLFSNGTTSFKDNFTLSHYELPKTNIEKLGLEQLKGIHKYALGSLVGNFTGVTSTLSVQNPKVTGDGQSISQIWISDSSKRGILEVGWHVYPMVSSGHCLFIYWTADRYQSTGCFNLQCKGFVQVDTKVVLGGVISQREISLAISQDKKTQNWWLLVDGKRIGYWPSALLKSIQQGASFVAAGGEVATLNGKAILQMGSGKFPSSGKGFAAYHRNIRVSDANHVIHDARLQTTLINTNQACYGIGNIQYNPQWGSHFFFGGPGCS